MLNLAINSIDVVQITVISRLAEEEDFFYYITHYKLINLTLI